MPSWNRVFIEYVGVKHGQNMLTKKNDKEILLKMRLFMDSLTSHVFCTINYNVDMKIHVKLYGGRNSIKNLSLRKYP